MNIKNCRVMIALLGFILFVVFAGGSVKVHADTFVVTNTNDSGAGSLRQAILNANTNVGLDSIDFNIPGDGPILSSP